MKMKYLPLWASLCAAVVMIGCTNFAQLETTLGTPTQVQADITILGAIAKPKISVEGQASIHKFANYLVAASALDTTELVAMIPKTGSINGDALISATVAFLNSTLAKYGARNTTTIAYMHGLGIGLLANF